MRRLVRAALLSVVAAAGCSSTGFEAEILDRRPFTPPTVYGAWWSATEACSGRTADLGRISWYLASSIVGDGRVARARWSPPHDIVIVAGYEDHEPTVRHEMLHDLLSGDRLHEAPAWSACALHAR